MSLEALCDTFIPAVERTDDPQGYWRRKGSDTTTPERIGALIPALKAEDRKLFEQLLWLMDSPMLGLTWGGQLRPFRRLTPAQREKMLLSWANSALPDLRQAYNSLRKLVATVYFGDADNPNYAAIGYARLPEKPAPDPAPLPVLPPPSGDLDCEVLIIGSGAGGSIVAAQLAAAGLDVLVVDKGVYSPTHALTQEEFPSIQRYFEAGGLLTSKDGSMSILAGSTMGGGTTINWAGSIRTPDYVLEEWAQVHGNPELLSDAFRQCFEAIEQRNNVHADMAHNAQNQALFDAAQTLGWKVGPIPINARFPEHLSPETAWKALGYSCYGDAHGIKQGAAQTFLKDAAALGARLMQQVDIEKIIVQNGVAAGARYRAGGAQGHIRAKKVVVAAGALHTPVLLQKSGLTHPQIGRNLWLHPVAPVAAFHARDIVPWQGPMMSVIVDEFSRLDGNWGLRIECPPVHPALASFALPWEGGASLKAYIHDIRQLAVNFALVRDREGGQVRVGKSSAQPMIHYRLSDYDKRHLLQGIKHCVRLHAVSGARHVIVPHNQPLHFRPEKDRLEDFLSSIDTRNWAPNRFSLFSAHQMGTCRMGGGKDYPVKPDGETREVRGLYVADASLFPSASGANPMLSVQALAMWVGRGMV